MQWMTERTSTEWIVLHHTTNGRSADLEKAYQRLVEEGKHRLESYSIVVLLDWTAKKALIKDMPWSRSKVTNHAFGISKKGIGISIDANFEVDAWEPWIENELVFLLVSLFEAKDTSGRFQWPELSVKRIIGHRDATRFDRRNATACPGRNFYQDLPRIIARLEAEIKKRGCYR